MKLIVVTLSILTIRDLIVYGVLTNGFGKFFVNPYLWSAALSGLVTFIMSYVAAMFMGFAYPETIAGVAAGIEVCMCLITLFSCFIAEHLEEKWQWLQHFLFVFGNNTVPAIKNVGLMMYMVGWASLSGAIG